MSDWKTRLKDAIEGNVESIPSDIHIKLSRMQMKNYFNGVVIPAFAELKEELEKYGRIISVTVDENLPDAILIVFIQKTEGRQEEEFFFEVRGRSYQKEQLAFPVHTEEERPRRNKVEILLRSGSLKEYELEDLPKEQIIDDFLAEYSKWVNF